MPISGTARLDAGAHDWPHRHAAATRTIRQATDTTTLTTRPPPPTGPWSPWSWPAAVVDCSTPVQYILLLLFSPVSPAPRRWRRQRGGVRGLRCQARSVSAARQLLATTALHCYHHLHVAEQRSARPKTAARRQLHFGLHLCHTAAAVPVWYYTPRMHACSQLCRPHAERHSLDGLVRTLPGLSRAFLALLASPASTSTSGSVSRGRWTTRIMGAYPS